MSIRHMPAPLCGMLAWKSTFAAAGQVSAEVGAWAPLAEGARRPRQWYVYVAYRSCITLYASSAQVLLSSASISTPAGPA